MTIDFSFKRITDPIHGNIGLSKLEAEVTGTRVFQRLHSVRQLGLAHLVYPGAGYSRFSHSIGACHNAYRMLLAIQRNSTKVFNDRELQLYRLVGLLHDIGHYPFSHATEHLVKDYYARTLVEGADEMFDFGGQTDADSAPPAYEHEDVGELIIRKDAELNEILKRHGFDGSEVADTFAGKKPDGLRGVISSDLDCDRLDYLRRTAHFSGAPYGSVDIDFIIDQATVDETGRFCLLPKALRAADHLLVSRYYDYMQVPYNKTVAGLEWSLVSALEALLRRGTINCSGSGVADKVSTGRWYGFDDQTIFEHLKVLNERLDTSSASSDAILRDHINGILRRNPPKTVACWEEIMPKDDTRTSKSLHSFVNIAVDKIVAELNIDPLRLHVWNSPLQLSKVGPEENGAPDDRVAEAIYILNVRSNKSRVLNYHKETLLHLLSRQKYVGMRLYYLPVGGIESPELQAKMRAIASEHIEPTS